MESAASAVSSTAAVIMVTVCACSSIAWRMRSARGLDLLDRLLDRAIGLDRLAGRLLDGGDLGGDVVGGAGGLGGEALHLLGDDGEAAAGIAGAGRLDGGVEGEQLVWPAMSRIRPRIDSIASTWADSAWLTLHGGFGLVAGAGGDAGGDLDFRPGILDGADEAGGGLRRLAHRGRRLLGGGGDFAGLAEHAAGGGGGRAGALGQGLGLADALADEVGDLALEDLGLLAALVGGLIGLEQSDLGEDDVVS